MPSKSPAQHNLMEGVAHDPAFAAEVGIPQSVGQEFVEADKANAHHFARGGTAARSGGGRFRSRIPDECK